MSLASGSHSHAGKPHNGRHATWSRLGEHQSTARALLTNNQRVVFVPTSPATAIRNTLPTINAYNTQPASAY